jgi:ATP-dependent metalloprotease
VSLGGGSERQTLNQLLSSMDGFAKHENVIVVAATNTPEILDPALTRPGRFDSTVNVPLPDVKGRQEIVELYLSRVVASRTLDPLLLARATPGFSGAQLEALINSAALMAAQRGADCIEPADIEEARDKLIMGPAKKSRVQKAELLRLTAYHEGGHTLAALKTPGAMDLHKVTIMPRGFSGGATYSLPRDDELETKEAVLAAIDVCMGGRVAEELVYGDSKVTTGAGMDMRQASALARRFCMAYSMSSLGLTSYADGTEPSPATRAAIDTEVEKILQESYGRVRSLLGDSRGQLDRLASALLEHETLDADEVRTVIGGGALPPLTERLARAKAAHGSGGAARGGSAAGAPASAAGGGDKPAAGSGGGKRGAAPAGGDGSAPGGGKKPLWAQARDSEMR